MYQVLLLSNLKSQCRGPLFQGRRTNVIKDRALNGSSFAELLRWIVRLKKAQSPRVFL